MKKFQSTILFFSISLLIGMQSIYAQNIDWAFHAPGLSGQPMIPTVQNTIAKDDAGNIYVTSSVVDSTQFGPFVIHGSEVVPGVYLVASYLAKFSPDGDVQWVQTFETAGGQLTIYDMTTDDNDNLIMVGHASGTVYVDSISVTTNFSAGEMFLAKFNNDGNVLWARISDSQPGFSSAVGTTVAMAPSGDIIVGGLMDFHVFFGTVEIMAGYNLFMASYNEDGGVNWARPYGTANPLAIRSDIGVDNDNNIYWVGSTSAGSSSDFTVFDTISFKPYAGSMFISKYNSTGDISWLNHYGEDSLSLPAISSFNLALHANDVIITGDFMDTVDMDGTMLIEPTFAGTHLFIAKFDATGDMLWAKQSHGIANGVNMFDMSLNSMGDAFVCGRVSSSVGVTEFILGEGAHMASMTVDGIDNGFLAKYKADGELDWLKGNAGLGISDARSVVTIGDNSAVINGIFTDIVHIGDTTFTASPDLFSGNFYMAFFDGDLSSVISIQTAEGSIMKVFPNPANDQVYVHLEDASNIFTLMLLDMQGRIIAERKNPKDAETFVIHDLPSGVYLISATCKKGRLCEELIVK